MGITFEWVGLLLSNFHSDLFMIYIIDSQFSSLRCAWLRSYSCLMF
jgi:hypothetical protein